VRFKRRHGSMRAAMRKREAIQPRKLYRAEVDAFLNAADSNTSFVKREWVGSVGVKERGEHTKVVRAYLGGLTDSTR
jgi:hypothetical protein